MYKFDLFIILPLVVLQNSYEVLSQKNETWGAWSEAYGLTIECYKLRNLISSEIIYHDITKIRNIIKEFDITKASYELNGKIREIEYKLKPSSKAMNCVTDAVYASSDAVIENHNATSNCSSEPISVTNTIKTELESIIVEVLYLRKEISGNINKCLEINDTTEILITECLQDITKYELNLTDINKDFYKQVPDLRAREEKNVIDLRICLVQIKDFNKTSENIMKTLTKCVEINAATDTYSKNIIFFCLCLFCLLQMI